ncbi:helix-hairpin-helix domain-containing protein [Streptomyces sp. NPDC090106]|uniref:helix-hairpin-helix domain-containing protein n=1 Tax=Streptomyces sp. NPDC090106 TaxID=3365946 RepID=UPI0038070E28
MALRSRTRTALPASGPGRGPASDVRARQRRRAAARHGRGQRYASADELRRRAETMFAERGSEPADEEREVRAAPVVPGVVPVPVSGAEEWRGRAGLALRERLPVWLQARCGLERRNAVALTVVLVVAAGFAVQHFWGGRTQAVRAPEVVRAGAPFGEPSGPSATAAGSGPAGGASGAGPSAAAEIVVDVSGKVREPGIHRLPAGSRVADALRAAGGAKPGTDMAGLNRARFLVDGEQVVVGGGPQAPAPAAPAPAAGAAAGGPAAPVSLNTATVDQLDTLPGVGPVLAQHIVDYRTRQGGFRSVDELREVNGIGERRFADLRNLVRP